MTAIEDLAKIYLANKSSLTSENLEQFFGKSKPHWWIAKFWHLPKTTFQFSLPNQFQDLTENNEKPFINSLLEKTKQIEVVSIILRFVRPDLYGILSSPVEQVLNVRWGSS